MIGWTIDIVTGVANAFYSLAGATADTLKFYQGVDVKPGNYRIKASVIRSALPAGTFTFYFCGRKQSDASEVILLSGAIGTTETLLEDDVEILVDLDRLYFRAAKTSGAAGFDVTVNYLNFFNLDKIRMEILNIHFMVADGHTV